MQPLPEPVVLVGVTVPVLPVFPAPVFPVFPVLPVGPEEVAVPLGLGLAEGLEPAVPDGAETDDTCEECDE